MQKNTTKYLNILFTILILIKKKEKKSSSEENLYGNEWAGLTGQISARSSTVTQQDVDEFEAYACGLEADLNQHRLDVG